MINWTITRNDTAFQGYTLPKERGPEFMRIVCAEREATKLFREYAELPVVTILDPEIENDFLGLRPMRVEIY